MAATPLPLDFAQAGWYTPLFIARRLGVPVRTVQYWCKNGFFIRRGCKVIFTEMSVVPYRQHWIYINPLSTDAMLSKVPIDIPCRVPYPSNHGGPLSRSRVTTLC